jgi:hypothetical protein
MLYAVKLGNWGERNVQHTGRNMLAFSRNIHEKIHLWDPGVNFTSIPFEQAMISLREEDTEFHNSFVLEEWVVIYVLHK